MSSLLSVHTSLRLKYPTSVRRTDFWERLNEVLDPGYSQSWARDIVLPDLGMSVHDAFASGIETRLIWQAVCECLDVPSHLK